jgi:hypothetical protein
MTVNSESYKVKSKNMELLTREKTSNTKIYLFMESPQKA